ncbi:sensor histidine kinase [Vibrio sp. S4M6]|uniref:ATP-binding protein n=1 Tax=Vibrio sinus TaxID=2946865 RepID=UPI00202A065B|nr:sensor histidine kinase [Vibrio sinus]MCL9783792.1 sensor histidine kinase [Vibrio sinus]
MSFLRSIYTLKSKLTFTQRVLLLLLSVAVVQVTIIAGFYHFYFSDVLKHQMRQRALVQAREIASDPQLIAAVKHQDVSAVHHQIARLQALTDAKFIVVGNKHGIRLAHPNPHKVGLPMQGGDNERALSKGLSYSSIRQGSLGWSVRGKSPIETEQGQIVGVVSVGYLLSSVNATLLLYSTPFFVLLAFVLFSSIFAAWLFSRHIRKQMYGMEPKEIATTLQLQKSVLETVYEGILAVDADGMVISANRQAIKTLGLPSNSKRLQGNKVEEILSPCGFFIGKGATPDELENAACLPQLIVCNGETLVATRVPLIKGDGFSGWVTSFRLRDSKSSLTSALLHVRQQTDDLRVLSHEYANKLSTISGLIQMGNHQQALDIIRKESASHQAFIDSIVTTFRSKVIAGLLLGKYSRAKELGLTLDFDPYCQLNHELKSVSEEELATIVGNLLDNAFEATLANPNSNRIVSLLLSDANDAELVIEVADNGKGIPDTLKESLFEKGISSKQQPGHGIGLYLIHQLVTDIGGTILTDDAEPNGTIFSIFIPRVFNPNVSRTKEIINNGNI